MSQLPLAFLAGLLTCLSPCVFPLLPLVVGSSLQRSRFGPLAMAFGMVCSYTVIGALLLSTGAVFGLAPSAVREVAGVMLILAGAFLLSSRLQCLASRVLAPIAAASERLVSRAEGKPGASQEGGVCGALAVQCLTGALLGAIWSPCNGPTLGAALALGAREGATSGVIATMLVFGLGAATPVVLFAYGAGALLARRTESVVATGNRLKMVFGVLVAGVGVMTLFGWDHLLESFAADHLPEWWIAFTAKY